MSVLKGTAGALPLVLDGSGSHYLPYCGPNLNPAPYLGSGPLTDNNAFKQFDRCANESYYNGDHMWASIFTNGRWIWPVGHTGTPASYNGYTTPNITSANGANAADLSGFINVIERDLNGPEANIGLVYLQTGGLSCTATAHGGKPAVEWCEEYAGTLVGTSYIINTMLGMDGTDPAFQSAPDHRLAGFFYARAHLNEWKDLVNYYAAQPAGGGPGSVWVDWNHIEPFPTTGTDPVSGFPTSYWRTDTIVYRDNPTMVSGFPASDTSKLDAGSYINDRADVFGPSSYIKFYNPDGTFFLINKSCGNITGPAAKLVKNFNFTINTAPQIDIADDENPSTADFSLNANTDDAPVNGVQISASYYVERVSGATITIHAPFSNTFNFTLANHSFPIDQPGVVLPAMSAGDKICMGYAINPQKGIATTSGVVQPGSTALIDRTCKTIFNKPYVRTFDGDSFAGANCGASTGWPATHDTGGNIDAGGIYGQGNDTGVTGRGSASQLAMLSLYEIRNFRSSIVKGGSQDRLLFGNTNLPGFSVTGGPKGGYLGLSHCPIDYLADMPGADNAVNLAADGTYKQTGLYTLPAANSFDKRVVIFIDGDVNITNDFKYNSAGWTDRSDIPSFTLVATGNIYIGENVTQLDGTYVAQGKGVNPPPQTIYTCAKTGAVPVGYLSTDASYYDNCNNQLTINGSLIAARIKFLRTFGSLRNSTGAGDHPSDIGGGFGTSGGCSNAGIVSSPGTCAAEVINFRPEAYLALPTGTRGKVNFDLVTTPPPLL